MNFQPRNYFESSLDKKSSKTDNELEGEELGTSKDLKKNEKN